MFDKKCFSFDGFCILLSILQKIEEVKKTHTHTPLLRFDMAFYQAPTGYQQQQKNQLENPLPSDLEELLQTQEIYAEADFSQSQPAYLEEVAAAATTPTTTTTNKLSASKKRGNEDELGLKEYSLVAKRLRLLEQNQLQTIGNWQPLSESEPGEVFVVDGCEEKTSAYGKMGLLKCRPLKGESGKRVICPPRFLDDSLYPCVMVYLGMVEMLTNKGKNGHKSGVRTQPKTTASKSKQSQQQQQMCHALRRYGGLNDVFASDAEMVSKANELRQMSVEELREKLEIKRLRCFPPGAVLVYFGYRTLPSTFNDGGEGVSHVVSYQTVADNTQQTGEVYIPERYANALKKGSSGVFVYKGLKTSKNSGAEYYDLEFMSKEVCAQLMADK